MTCHFSIFIFNSSILSLKSGAKVQKIKEFYYICGRKYKTDRRLFYAEIC